MKFTVIYLQCDDSETTMAMRENITEEEVEVLLLVEGWSRTDAQMALGVLRDLDVGKTALIDKVLAVVRFQ